MTCCGSWSIIIIPSLMIRITVSGKKMDNEQAILTRFEVVW